MKVFASTFMYSACKVVGPDVWHAPDAERPGSLKYELSHMSESAWDGFRTIDELLSFSDADVYVDASTYIDRARCVAARQFLASECDVWLTVDDDLYAERDVLAALLSVCRASLGGVAVPYLNRDGKKMTYRFQLPPTVWVDGHPVRVVDRCGFGLVALHRDYVQRLAERVPFFSLHGLPGEARTVPHLFRNGIDDDGTWMGEDFSFCKLAEDAGEPMLFLLEAPTRHAGLLSKLDDEGRICVPSASPLAGELAKNPSVKENETS